MDTVLKNTKINNYMNYYNFQYFKAYKLNKISNWLALFYA